MKKKLFLILLIAVFITAFAYSQKITVTNPHSGSTWYKGQAYTIKWTKSGAMDSKVKIRLFQGGRKILDITNNTANNGSYNWKVPATLADGNYIIRVKTVDNHVFDDSDSFIITKKVATSRKITITYPHSGDKWVKGMGYKIKWTKSGGMNPNVKIELYQGSTKVLSITNNTPNNGYYNWQIPRSLPDGFYTLKIKTVDNLVSADNVSFEIGTFDIIVKEPGDSYSTLYYGYTYPIKWEARGNLNSKVRITLFNQKCCEPEKKILDIISSTDNDGLYNWKVPESIPPDGNYEVKIETIDNKVRGWSRDFL